MGGRRNHAHIPHTGGVKDVGELIQQRRFTRSTPRRGIATVRTKNGFTSVEYTPSGKRVFWLPAR